MLNYFLRLRRKKGFTLTELIIVIAILAILMACIAALSGPIRKMVNRTATSADAVTANTTMANYIENRLSFASNIDMLFAYDADNGSSNANVNTLFANYKSFLSSDKDKAGIIVFHYEEDTDFPEESHYRIYDIPITAASSTYQNAAVDISTSSLKDSTAVFADCFYQYSKNLFIFNAKMTPDKYSAGIAPEVMENATYDHFFLTLDIIPYNFQSDMLVYDASGALDTTIAQYISSSTIPDYYNYKYNRETEIATQAPAPTYTDSSNGLSAMDLHRMGTKETATFELHNIMTATASDPNPSITTRFKVDNGAKTSAATAGTDIMIFYYVPHY